MIWGNTKSVDLYINYNCDLRCNHCFVGNMLSSKYEMPLELACQIIDSCAFNGIETVTLLGGEPCLHSNIIDIIKFIDSRNLKIRIVTNGQNSFQKLILEINDDLFKKIHISFSIDGSCSVIFDKIRGANSFNKLRHSINLAIEKNLSISSILSVNILNYEDVINVILLCERYKMSYINIHFVTNRGFASSDKIISVKNWIKLCNKIKSIDFNIMIRIEETFIPISKSFSCGVKEKYNIVIDPYGRLYGCTMFLDYEKYYTAIFRNGNWEKNKNVINENNLCENDCNGCPAVFNFNEQLIEEANGLGFNLDCIFNKTSY